nr:hypothetical protein [Tanacetum cinerariifolium]
MLDVKSFKDKLTSGIKKNPYFQRLARYPISARAFVDPILFLAGLQSLWEHGQQRHAIFMGDKDVEGIVISQSHKRRNGRIDARR